MPNLNLGLAAAETVTICGNYNGDHFAVYSDPSESSAVSYKCENCDAMNAQLDLGTSVRICATCDVVREAFIGVTIVSNCKLTDDTKTVKCHVGARLDYSTTSPYGRCVRCSNGKTMFPLSQYEFVYNYGNYYHAQTTNCDYCLFTQYLPTPDAEKCVVCPDSGKTDGDGHLGIQRCYITTIPDDGADESGTYVYRRDIDKCYHD